MSNIVSHKGISFKLLYNRQKIEEIVRDLAKQINQYYESLHEEKLEVVVVCVLKGAFMFYSDLVKLIKFNHYSEFIRCRSYKGLESGVMTIETELKPQIFENKYVLIVQDIHDSGNTLKQLIAILTSLKPKKIDTVVLVKRPDKPVQIDLRFYGLTCGDFIIGYGLDFDEFGRHLPQIYQKI